MCASPNPTCPHKSSQETPCPLQNVLNPNLTLASPWLKFLPPQLPTALRIECRGYRGPQGLATPSSAQRKACLALGSSQAA